MLQRQLFGNGFYEFQQEAYFRSLWVVAKHQKGRRGRNRDRSKVFLLSLWRIAGVDCRANLFHYK